MIAWLRRLASFDTRVFDEVRSNPAATLPGVIFAAGSLFLAGIGGWLWWSLEDYGNAGDILVHSTIIGSIIALVLWCLAWVGIVYFILTQLFRERAYLEQLMRVMGLAATPLSLMLLMFVPGISFGIGLTALVLTFGLNNIAIQSVTTANPARVLVANGTGFLVWAAALSLLASASISTVEPHAPGIFLYNTTTTATQDLLSLGQEIDSLFP